MASSLSLCVRAHELFESNQIHEDVQKKAILSYALKCHDQNPLPGFNFGAVSAKVMLPGFVKLKCPNALTHHSQMKYIVARCTVIPANGSQMSCHSDKKKKVAVGSLSFKSNVKLKPFLLSCRSPGSGPSANLQELRPLWSYHFPIQSGTKLPIFNLASL